MKNYNLAVYVTMNNDALVLEANYVTFFQQNNIMDETNEHFGKLVVMGNLVIDCYYALKRFAYACLF